MGDENILQILFYSFGMILFVIAFIVNYILTAYPLYKMFQKAGLKNPKYAFIPIVNSIKFLNLANFSGWYYLILLVPFIGSMIFSIFLCYVHYQIAKNYGLDVLGCILTVLFPIPVYWYLALSDKQFIGNLDPKYSQYSFNDYSL